MRSRTARPSASDIKVTLSRFGKKRRLVLMLEWLTLCPTCADLPLSSHRHVIGEALSLGFQAAHRRNMEMMQHEKWCTMGMICPAYARPQTSAALRGNADLYGRGGRASSRRHAG